jgi:hypothetical protein
MMYASPSCAHVDGALSVESAMRSVPTASMPRPPSIIFCASALSSVVSPSARGRACFSKSVGSTMGGDFLPLSPTASTFSARITSGSPICTVATGFCVSARGSGTLGQPSAATTSVSEIMGAMRASIWVLLEPVVDAAGVERLHFTRDASSAVASGCGR